MTAIKTNSSHHILRECLLSLMILSLNIQTTSLQRLEDSQSDSQSNILSGNSHHWNVSKWYFRRSSNSPLSVIILLTHTRVREFASFFLPRIHREFNTALYLTSIEPTLANPNANGSLTLYDCDNCHDTHSGYLIIAADVSSLLASMYAIQQSQPVWHPRSRFLVLLVAPAGCAMPRYEQLLETMWTRFHILHVLVMTVYADTCQISKQLDLVTSVSSRPQETKIVFYDPFYNNGDGGWGRVRYFAAKALDAYKDLVTKKLRKNLMLYPVTAVIFERVSTAILDVNTNDSYYGIDGYTLRELAKYMNVDMKISEPSDKKMFGYKDKNGIFRGAIGDVVYGRAEIAFNSRFVKDYGTDAVVFTHQMDVDDVCLVVPKAARMPQWLAMASCYNGVIYLLIVVSYVTFVALSYTLRRLRSHYKNERDANDIGKLFLDAYRPFVSTAIFKGPVASSERILAAVFIIAGALLCYIFQGSLVKSITHPLFYPDIDTLEELDASGLHIRSGSQALDDSLYPGDPVMARLAARIDHLYGGQIGPQRVAATGNLAAFIRRSDLSARIPAFRAADGTPLLHLMRECPKMYYLAFMVPRLSPYLPQVNHFIHYVFESGLVKKWDRMAIDRMVNTARMNRTEGFKIVDGGLRVFTVLDLQLPFYVLGAGISASGVVFLFELKVWTRFRPIFAFLSKTRK